MKPFPDDTELVERFQKGDVEIFDLIYEKYSSKLYLFALKYLKSSVESEELIQSVFMKVWENQKKLKKESSFKSFLFTITYNEICKIFRKRNYHQKFVNEFVVENIQASSEFEKEIDCKSFEERIWKIVDMLPERQKNIFRSSREGGKTTKEIAADLGLSPGTIDNYISESIRFIRRHLQNEGLAIMLFVTLYFF